MASRYLVAGSRGHNHPETSQPRDLETSISALTGRGIEQLVEMIRGRELAGGEVVDLEIPHEQSRVMAKLHEVAEIYEQRGTDRATRVTAWIPRTAIHQFDDFSVSNSLKRAKVS